LSEYRLLPLYRQDRATGHERVVAYALVDAEAWPELASHTWRLANTGYAYRSQGSGQSHILLHRHLLGLDPGSGKMVDHINRYRLDDRRANLQAGDQVANSQNKSPYRQRAGTQIHSEHRGVHWDSWKRRWKAVITVNGRQLRRRFKSENEAAAQAAEWRRQFFPFSEEARASTTPRRSAGARA